MLLPRIKREPVVRLESIAHFPAEFPGRVTSDHRLKLPQFEKTAARPDGITRFRLAAAYLENLIISQMHVSRLLTRPLQTLRTQLIAG